MRRGDTLVASAEGLVRIGSLHQGEPEDSFREEHLVISSLDGDRKTDAFYYGGRRPVRRVTLRSGHSVTGTLPHRLLIAGARWPGVEVAGRNRDRRCRGGAIRRGTLVGDSSKPARHPASRGPMGTRSRSRLPHRDVEELAFLLGAYAAEGHTISSNWTITITNSVPEVLERVRRAWESEFGLRARITAEPGRCPGVVVASKTVVEFMAALGCGSRASEKRIPDAVLCSPREMVLSFLQGLALDAYVTTKTAPNGQSAWTAAGF